MSLSLKRKKEIGCIRLAWCFMLKPNGDPIGVFPKRRLPTSEEIREMVLEELAEKGYSARIIRLADANCVIRVYRNLKHTHNMESYCLIGAVCYTKVHGSNKWGAYDENENVIETMDYENHRIENIFEPENSEKIETEFFDTYVKVTK